MFDDHGSEFFAVIPHQIKGRSYRERRKAALGEILTAIEAGYPPGEVPVNA